jgi:hypothetical protein
MRSKILGLLALALLAGPMAANALVLDFEGSPDSGAITQTVDGYTFNFTADGWGIFRDTFVGGGAPYTHNGTTRLVAAGDRDGVTAQVTMSQGGNLFSLFSVDVATLFPDIGNGEMEIIGSLNAGGTISRTLPLFTSFSSVSLVGFENLTSAVFRTTLSASFRSEPGFSIDNLYVNERRRVPESGTLALLGLGLAGLGLSRRRKAA